MGRLFWALIVIAAVGAGCLPLIGLVFSLEGDLEFSQSIKHLLAVLFSIAYAAVVWAYFRFRH